MLTEKFGSCKGRDLMILNERKIKILEAIINDYIATAEPIGSRTIAKKYDLGISSATIRNEMSDLEELGFIIQPHTSSGRVPSDRGYRLYVDRLLHFRKLTQQETDFLRNTVAENINHIEYLMRQTAKALSVLTNYATVVSEPKPQEVKIKHVQVIPFDETSVIIVVVMDNKSVKNNVIKVERAPDFDILNQISNIVNQTLREFSLEQIISKEAYADFLNSPYGKLIDDVFISVIKTVRDEREMRVYTSGVNNILDFPEFSDIDKAKNVFKILEEKDMLIDILDDSNGFRGNLGDIKILIGNENSFEQLKDCSIIKTDYKYGDNSYGSIGIIGPTRMNYAQVIPVLNSIVNNINDVIKALSDGKG